MLLFARSLRLNLARNYNKPSADYLKTKISEGSISSKYAAALEKFHHKIWFNSVLEVQNARMKQYERHYDKKEKRRQEYLQQQVKPLPLILNQLCNDPASGIEKQQHQEEDDDDNDEVEKQIYDLPYSRFLKVEKSDEVAEEAKEDRIPKNWLQDYELYDEGEEEMNSTYGTPNPKVPISNVPCHGCGALLHCKNSSIPGYVPSELFGGLTKAELTKIHCQRCHFLVNYNTAINVQVTPEDYINIIATIKDKFALAIILVDLLDFPCSIFNGLSEVLGPKRPVFIVGNKVDLLPKDQPDYLNHIKRCLKKEAVSLGFEERFIKHISLISAKTGYGIEELITKLHSVWKSDGDVYLVGCTNVGKSSLFNALLRSDYCKVEASDIIQRATACPWPGTTLRMLKFPILRPSDYRIFLRTTRLRAQQTAKFQESSLRREQAKSTKQIKHATLIGHIGRSFEKEKPERLDPVSQSHTGGFSDKIFTLNEKSQQYLLSKWCFDTPGVIQRDQVSWAVDGS